MKNFKQILGLLALTQFVGGYTPAPVSWVPVVKVMAVDATVDEEPELELSSFEVKVILGEEFNPMDLVVGGNWDTLETPFVDVSELTTTEAVFVARKGNQSVTRSVRVHVVDGTAPEFTKLNKEVIKVSYGGQLAVNRHFEAVDNIDGVITDYSVVQDFDNKKLGLQDFVFAVTDSSGNTVSETLKVNVVDVKAPVIQRTQAKVAVEWNEKIDVLKYFSAKDDVDGDVSVKVVQNYKVGRTGNNTVVVSATDRAGNTSEASMVVQVKLQPDHEAPKITRKQDQVTVNYGQKVKISNYFTVTDNIDKVVKLTVNQSYNAKKVGSQVVKVSAKDRYGNVSRSEITIVVKEPVKVTTVSGGAVSSSGVAGLARKQLGKRYVFGTAGPNTFDCSGLVKWVYAQYGVSLPHSATAQSRVGRAVNINNMAEWKPGDILIYGRGSRITHAAIYVGGGMSVHALNKNRPVIMIKARGVTAPIVAVRRIF